jgi:hypothetical protein
VGGFALSQYLVVRSDREAAAIRGELQTELRQISATAERLERATLRDGESNGRAADGGAGGESVTVAATVGPCRARAVDGQDVPAGCAESDAVRVTLCGSVPAASLLTATLLFARPEDSRKTWDDSRVTAGQSAGRARFPDEPFQQTEAEQTKQVCAVFTSWDSERAYSARLVVKYVSVPAGGVSNALLVPTSRVGQ